MQLSKHKLISAIAALTAIIVFVFALSVMCSEEAQADGNPELQMVLLEQGWFAIPLAKNKFGHYTAEATINGHEANFLVDSGATTTVLDTDFIDDIEVDTKKSKILAVGVGGKQGFLKAAQINELMIGDLDVGESDIKVMSMDHVNHIYAKHGVKPLTGILGADYLHSHQSIINLESQILWLKPIKS